MPSRLQTILTNLASAVVRGRGQIATYQISDEHFTKDEHYLNVLHIYREIYQIIMTFLELYPFLTLAIHIIFQMSPHIFAYFASVISFFVSGYA